MSDFWNWAKLTIAGLQVEDGGLDWTRRTVLRFRQLAQSRTATARRLYLTVDHSQVRIGPQLGRGIDKVGYVASCDIDLPGVAAGARVCYKSTPRTEGRREAQYVQNCLWNDQIWGELMIWALLRLGEVRGTFAGVVALVEKEGEIVGYLAEFCDALEHDAHCAIEAYCYGGYGDRHVCCYDCAGDGEIERSDGEWTRCSNCDGSGEIEVDVSDRCDWVDQYCELTGVTERLGITDQHTGNIGILDGCLVSLDYGYGSAWMNHDLEEAALKIDAVLKSPTPQATTPRDLVEIAGARFETLFTG
jgi:hypothetical protein